MRRRGTSENLGKGEKHQPLENGNATTPPQCIINRSCWFLLQTIISFLSKIRGVRNLLILMMDPVNCGKHFTHLTAHLMEGLVCQLVVSCFFALGHCRAVYPAQQCPREPPHQRQGKQLRGSYISML